MERNVYDPEQLLDRIFSLTEGLYQEMSGDQAEGGGHGSLHALLTELGRTLAQADRCSFWKWNKAAHQIETTAQVGTEKIVIPDDTGLVGRSLREERAIVTNDPYHCPDFNPSVDQKTGYLTRSILVMPIKDCKGQIIGAYQAINKLGDGEGFDLVEDCRRLSLAAFICGITLESDLFLDESQKDKLTGVRNRTGFHTDYPGYERLLQDPDYDKGVSLVICDIDFFKKVNDTYGHNAGDAVLVHVAKTLSSAIRLGPGRDTVYRWGGEEFIIMLPGANLEQSAMVAERMRSKIEETICEYEGTKIPVTMSFGCTELTLEKNVEENVAVADRRLYLAKEGGRNRVVMKG